MRNIVIVCSWSLEMTPRLPSGIWQARLFPQMFSNKFFFQNFQKSSVKINLKIWKKQIQKCYRFFPNTCSKLNKWVWMTSFKLHTKEADKFEYFTKISKLGGRHCTYSSNSSSQYLSFQRTKLKNWLWVLMVSITNSLPKNSTLHIVRRPKKFDEISTVFWRYFIRLEKSLEILSNCCGLLRINEL